MYPTGRLGINNAGGESSASSWFWFWFPSIEILLGSQATINLGNVGLAHI